MSDAPERIWLQDGGDYAATEPSGEVTWCADQVEDSDTEYVRADRLEAIEAENRRLREERNTLRQALFDYGDRSKMGRVLRASLEAYGKARAVLSTDGGEG